MSTQTRRQAKMVLIALSAPAALFFALIAAYAYFIAVPRFEEVARTGQVKSIRPSESELQKKPGRP